MYMIGICGLLGYETAERLYKAHKEELGKRFSRRFLQDFRNLENGKVKVIQSRDPLFLILEIGKGGLLGTLWEACEIMEKEVFPGSPVGCELDLFRVPVRQEIVEICELYEENPYEVLSGGSFLVIWDETKEDKIPPDGLRILEKSDIIGKLTRNHQRVLRAGEHVRYLTPAERQEKDLASRKHRNSGEAE